MNSPNIAPLLSGHVIGSVNDAFVIAEWRDPGGPPGPPRLIAPRHLHRSDDEAWYVLEGTLRVQVGKEEVEAPGGFGRVRAARNASHLLESRPKPGSVFAGHDLQHQSIDSGNPRDE